jgi:hypothetical protein
MTKICKSIALCLGASAFAWAGLTFADDDAAGRNFQAKLRLRVEYDDNIYGNGVIIEKSMKVEVEPEFIYNLNLPQSYLGFRVRPSIVYWEDRPSDDLDFHVDFDVDFNHNFSPRATLTLKESLLYAELPELMESGAMVQQKDTYLYNRLNADFSYMMARQTKASVAGRYTILRYDDNDVAKNEDYDIYAAGLSLSHQISMATTISGEARYESITYDGADRDADSVYLGAGVDQMFGPDLIGNIRGGIQNKEFSADGVDSATEPYVDASITALTPSHRTRVTLGVGYSMFEADVYPYASQDRALVFVSAAHDLTARVTLYASGSYQESSYNGSESVDQTIASDDGTEEIVQVSGRGSYKLNASNWLEANIQYMDVSSDIREDYDRLRVSIGWRTSL